MSGSAVVGSPPGLRVPGTTHMGPVGCALPVIRHHPFVLPDLQILFPGSAAHQGAKCGVVAGQIGWGTARASEGLQDVEFILHQ